MNSKQMASLLTKEEKVLVQGFNNISANIIYRLLEALTQERAKVERLTAQLRKANSHG